MLKQHCYCLNFFLFFARCQGGGQFFALSSFCFAVHRSVSIVFVEDRYYWRGLSRRRAPPSRFVFLLQSGGAVCFILLENKILFERPLAIAIVVSTRNRENEYRNRCLEHQSSYLAFNQYFSKATQFAIFLCVPYMQPHVSSRMGTALFRVCRGFCADRARLRKKAEEHTKLCAPTFKTLRNAVFVCWDAFSCSPRSILID
jgi:hypothetical protein